MGDGQEAHIPAGEIHGVPLAVVRFVADRDATDLDLEIVRHVMDKAANEVGDAADARLSQWRRGDDQHPYH
jgi:hypothetical protein